MAERRLLRSVALALTLVLAGLVGQACGASDGSSAPTTAVPLDGSPRYPDAEGVVVDIAADFSTLTLDGDRTYRIQEDVQSFSALDGSVQQLLRRKGQYVQLGLKDDNVRWISGIAAVVRTTGQPPVVYYSGNLVEVREGKAVFEAGTVLTLGPGVAAPDGAVRVMATIDAEAHVVVALVAT